jgi:glycosyltransferase involved in cell wall biosynthesis
LADALDELLNAPELREKLTRAARAKIEERFSIDRNAKRLQTLFQQGVSR